MATPAARAEVTPLLASDADAAPYKTGTSAGREAASASASADPSASLNARWPSLHVGCCGSIFFSWVTPLMALGNQRPLEDSDLYQLDPHNRATQIASTFHAKWAEEKRRAGSRKPNLAWTLARAFGGKFAAAGVLKLVHDLVQFVGPLIIKRIIAYLSDPHAPLSEGLLYAAVIFVAGVVQSFALRQYFFYCFETGMQLRSAVVTAVFDKSLVLSASARQKRTTGEITNLMSIDAQRLQDMTPYLHAIWYALFQIVGSCVLLWQQIGAATIAGVAVILLMVPIMAMVSKAMRRLQVKLMHVKDERIKICHEVLSGIKVLKMQAWENSFAQRVLEARQDELDRLRIYILAQSGSNAQFMLVPALVTTVSFWMYVLLGHVLDVGTALASLALFNILRFPLFMLPQVITNLVESSVSFERLRNFLLDEERVPVTPGDLTQIGVRIDHADFQWASATTESSAAPPTTSNGEELCDPANADADQAPPALPTLRDISLEAHAGQLHAIVGHVGCGKSTLLGSLLGDAHCVAGSVALRGSVAYVSQQPFIQNASVRDNICFGRPYDAAKYKRAITVSCLVRDLQVLPAGDRTEIGEKGINLSGGQRTRVALARAVYQDADIYVLDDILSAVDAQVGSKIFADCIKSALQHKLVLLVTHSLTCLSHCDNIVVLEQGRIREQGAYKQLMAKKGVLANMVANYMQNEQEQQHQHQQEAALTAESPADRVDEVGDDRDGRQDRRSRASSTRSESEYDETDAQLIVDEDRSIGDVQWPVYRAWIRAFGGAPMAVLVLTLFAIAQGVSLAGTMWISYWSEHAQHASTPKAQLFYVYVYMGINGVFAVLAFFRVLALYAGGLRASRVLFANLLARVLRAPIAFFDTTPLGRIVNRLSKDIYTVDESLPSTWNGLLATLVLVLVTLATISYVTPWFIALLVPVLVMYVISQRYFIKTSRELQRLDSISRSPIFALLSEVLDGLPTIRAYRVEPNFSTRNANLLDKNQRAFFLNFSVNCWLALRLEFVGTVIASGAAFAAVLAHTSDAKQGALFAGLVGVSLTYAFDVTQSLNWTVRMWSQLQTQMVSVERIQSYSEMAIEAPLKSRASKQPPATWPSRGAITFDKISLRYRPHLPCVLREISFQVRPREKLGIVGRTGAGKSSVMVALLRLVELDAGRILIDDVDISQIGLHDLRGKLAIIPQDPVLFSGTVRFNLDPFEQYSDAQLWEAIQRAHLQRVVASLDAEVDERGGNFSVGERQLLSIARALLKRCRVILLDEATASIDAETDAKIQRSIRQEFQDATCLIIAHRLNTILDADRILVLDHGRVAELGSPHELQQHADGIFATLVEHWRVAQNAQS